MEIRRIICKWQKNQEKKQFKLKWLEMIHTKYFAVENSNYHFELILSIDILPFISDMSKKKEKN